MPLPFVWPYLFATLLVFASPPVAAANRNLPTCDAQVVKRQGNNISLSLDALTKSLNDKLSTAHSHISILQLTSEGDNLKIAGKRDGTSISLSGPLQVTGGGRIQVHANHIHDGGMEVKGIMEIFGKNLSDYIQLKQTGFMSVQGNYLRINPDRLLGLRGRVTSVKLQKANIEVRFASQPCQ